MATDPRHAPDPRCTAPAAVRDTAAPGAPVPRRSREDLAVTEDHGGWVSRSRVFLACPAGMPGVRVGQ